MGKLTVGSLFAGVGGIDLGFKNAGFLPIWSNEINEDACTTMQINFKHDVIHDDIKNLSKLKKVDVIVAGFPCQAFSVAGYRKGLKDKRGAIFYEMVRIINAVKPKAILLENVKNLVTHNSGRTMCKMKNELESIGYKIQHSILNTCNYSNLPQNRERVYIVGFRKSRTGDAFSFPNPVRSTSSIRDKLEKSVDNYYYYNDSKYYPKLKKEVTNKNTCYQWRRHYVRENKSNLCPTLTANMGTGGHNVPLILDSKGIRKLTPRECFRLQGFPETFKLPEIAKSKLYQQAGNSVSVPVIKKIALSMYNALIHI